MDFLDRAGHSLSFCLCECCEGEILPEDAVAFTVDGDNERVRARAQHRWCYDFVQQASSRAAALAKATAYADAAKCLEHQPLEEARLALKTRAEQAWRVAMRPTLDVRQSGSDIWAALFGKRAS